jgi:hypothetical protein
VIPPRSGTPEYVWWSKGADAEAAARDGNLSPAARELRDSLEALAELDRAATIPGLLTGLAAIYCPDRLRRKWRGVAGEPVD